MADKVGFIGLGTMGLPMARSLREAGVEVTGWDVNASARSLFDPCADSLESLARSRGVVITMLPEAAHVREVIQQCLHSGGSSHKLFIDCSTIDVASTNSLAEMLYQAGHGFIDAPVSGGSEAAASGSLSFMIGGTPDDIERGRTLLDIMGSKQIEFGAAGSGQAAKACHNMICGITAMGVCESFALADSLGLDLDRFYQLCRGAAAQSWILENRCPVPGPSPTSPSSNDYRPGFAARLMAKDLALAQQAADASGQETEFGALAAQRFNEFVETADGDLDFSSIYRSIRK
ncbi:MAG: NAD(P)-dependent oxidoreductase [Arenicellales bacterium]